MSCVMTKKKLTDFLFLEVLSHNVGDWNHVLFMGLSLIWNIGHVDLRLCSTIYIIMRVNFHSKKLIALHMVSVFFFVGGGFGESWNSQGFSQVMRERIFSNSGSPIMYTIIM